MYIYHVYIFMCIHPQETICIWVCMQSFKLSLKRWAMHFLEVCTSSVAPPVPSPEAFT